MTHLNFSLKNSCLSIGLLFITLASHAQPQETQAQMVTSCSYIETIEGNSGYGKQIDWRSIAKFKALEQANQLGASHVVWERLHPVGAFNGIAIAKAYKCNT